MSLFSQVIVGMVLLIIAIAIIGVIIFIEKPTNWPWSKKIKGGTEDLRDNKSDDTLGMAFHVINVYNPDGSLYKSQRISEISESGYKIGRVVGNDLVIDNSRYVSSDHALLYYSKSQDKYYIKDTDSKSGTFDSSKRRVSQLVVEDGMEFYIANIRCKFEYSDPFEEEIENDKPKTLQYKSSKQEEESIGNIYI